MRSIVVAPLFFGLVACSAKRHAEDAKSANVHVDAVTDKSVKANALAAKQQVATTNAVEANRTDNADDAEGKQVAAAVVREPRNVRELRAFCAARHNVPSQGEGGGEFLPFDTPHTWRCKTGRVLVCSLGASGRDCMQEMEVDAERMAAFREWCAERPNGNIPYSLSTGLHSTWECRGTRPVMIDRGPVDRDGYVRGAWEPL